MTLNTDAVVGKFLQNRDEIARIESEAKEKINAIKEQQAKLETWLRLKLEADGEESKRTVHGTVFFTTVDYAQMADWNSFLPFVIQNEAWDMLEKRVAKTAVRAFVNDTREVPPGVTYGTKKEINIRKPTNKSS
jgi:hypothetical protein